VWGGAGAYSGSNGRTRTGGEADGQDDGGGSGDEANRVCGIILGGVQERGQDAVVGGVKEVNQNDDKGRKDIVDVHGHWATR